MFSFIIILEEEKVIVIINHLELGFFFPSFQIPYPVHDIIMHREYDTKRASYNTQALPWIEKLHSQWEKVTNISEYSSVFLMLWFRFISKGD